MRRLCAASYTYLELRLCASFLPAFLSSLQVVMSKESRKTPRDMLDRERTGREWAAGAAGGLPGRGRQREGPARRGPCSCSPRNRGAPGRCGGGGAGWRCGAPLQSGVLLLSSRARLHRF